MTVFVDTSAFYAFLDTHDRNHEIAKKAWTEFLSQGELLVTSNYVIVETDALLRKRAGLAVVRKFHEDILPAITIAWVDQQIHASGVNATLAGSKGGPSLVDCVSFAMMRQLGLKDVFAFDSHFADQGFACKP